MVRVIKLVPWARVIKLVLLTKLVKQVRYTMSIGSTSRSGQVECGQVYQG